MSVFNFLCTEIGHFWPNRDPPKMNPKFQNLSEHHISFQSELCTCSPHFFLRLHLLTTFLLRFALAHHISFHGCTCSPHFFLRLHLLTTFLFTMQKLFLSRFRVTFATLVATSGFYPNGSKDQQRMCKCFSLCF